MRNSRKEGAELKILVTTKEKDYDQSVRMNKLLQKSFDYDTYKKHYYEQELKNARKGYTMNEPMLSEGKARERYGLTKMYRMQEVASGDSKGVGNVYQYMVRDQSAPNSYAQALAYKKFADITDQKVKLRDILHTEDLKEILDFSMVKDYEKDLREALKDQGLTKHQINAQIDKEISRVFFGSL